MGFNTLEDCQKAFNELQEKYWLENTHFKKIINSKDGNIVFNTIGIDQTLNFKVLIKLDYGGFFGVSIDNPKSYYYLNYVNLRTLRVDKCYQIKNLGFEYAKPSKYDALQFEIKEIELTKTKYGEDDYNVVSDILQFPQQELTLNSDLQQLFEEKMKNEKIKIKEDSPLYFWEWLNKKENYPKVSEICDDYCQKLIEIKEDWEKINPKPKKMVLKEGEIYEFRFLRFNDHKKTIIVQFDSDEKEYAIPQVGHTKLYYSSSLEAGNKYKVQNLGKVFENKRDKIGKFNFSIEKI